jgi:hypothetical protein
LLYLLKSKKNYWISQHIYSKYNLTSSTAEAKKVLPKSDLVAKGYRISGNYADNQLVIGNDISK